MCRENDESYIRIFICGDVMAGRGIDQILPFPVNPTLHEPYMKDARSYVEIAEHKSGRIRKPVDFSYIWGDAIDEFRRMFPDLKIINLETSLTQREEYWKGKEIHYRMHPKNVPCFTAAGIDWCALANNHVLDWGYAGLVETLRTLKQVGVASAGAGANLQEAQAPSSLEVTGKGRVLLFSCGSTSSGIWPSWAAKKDRAGVYLLEDLSIRSVDSVAEIVRNVKQKGDIVLLSIHWGPNWGYEIPAAHREFAHHLVEEAGIDIIHGHSSHHVKGIEVYQGKLILYGCGDFLNDYEGIHGKESFRGDLSLMYFATINPSAGNLVSLEMTPTRTRHFRVNRASEADAMWLKDVLNREGAELDTRTEKKENHTLLLKWGV